MSITFSFLWYDFWIGWYYDQKKHLLYICPLPMCLFTIDFGWSSAKNTMKRMPIIPAHDAGKDGER